MNPTYCLSSIITFFDVIRSDVILSEFNVLQIILLDLFGYKNFAYHLANNSKNINRKTLNKINKKIIFNNKVDSLLMKFPINLLIKILIRYKIMRPINPQLHF